MEEWKDIPIDGICGYYQASNLGRIRSFSKKQRNKNGIIKLDVNLNGRVKVCLQKHFEDGTYKRTPLWLARVIALTFCPNPNNYPEVNHIDENPTNNRADNLEWCTRYYNQHYGSAIIRATETHYKPVCSIDENGVMVVYASVTHASKCVGCDVSSICKCLLGKYSHTYHRKWYYYDKNFGTQPSKYSKHNKINKNRYHNG